MLFILYSYLYFVLFTIRINFFTQKGVPTYVYVVGEITEI